MTKPFVCKFPEDGWTVWDFNSRTVTTEFESWQDALEFSLNPTAHKDRIKRAGMTKYSVGMHKEQWVVYEAETPEEAMKLAAINNPEWTVMGADDG